MLLDQPNIKVNLKDKDGNTALMKAIQSTDVNTVATMLNACAIPFLSNKNGQSVLDIADQLRFPFR